MCTPSAVCRYSEEGYPLAIFDNGIVEGGKVVQKGDARFRGSKPKTLTVEAWREVGAVWCSEQSRAVGPSKPVYTAVTGVLP